MGLYSNPAPLESGPSVPEVETVPVKPAGFQAGDKVVWKGIDLTVHSIRENGDVFAISLTMQVIAQPDQFTLA
jgi:hypothetical protein